MTLLCIEGGSVVDGTGSAGRQASVLIEEDTIKEVAPGLQAPEGTARIDASGLVVAPGFIDIHAHEFGLLTDPTADSKLRPAFQVL